MAHITLLGDSIFDNGVYVPGQPDVVSQLHARLPRGWQAELRAIDGACVADVAAQLAQRPAGTTHLVLSVGGNDALGQAEIFNQPVTASAQVFAELAAIREGFNRAYGRLLDQIGVLDLPTVVCTIYDPNFAPLEYRAMATAALTVFNDVITRHVFGRGWPLIDLRLLFDSPADYANPIEPSVQGGEKLTERILQVVQTHDFGQGRSYVF
ncbi:MAG: SGNH/GDSL hydrolase family protein [Gloeomargaritaceae cyanobacterium C42_A2020_066]|nr:SGNH/GDSL hydrolase family protein [Gloeomargaritaceae cyanobacterium C42_A2020_066]